MIAPHTKPLIDFLNTMLEVDRYAIAELLATDVVCNDAMADHPTVQVREGTGKVTYQPVGQHRLTILGLLNGFCGVYEDTVENRIKGIVNFGPIMAVYENGRLDRFIESKDFRPFDATDEDTVEPPQTQTLSFSRAVVKSDNHALRSYDEAERTSPAGTGDWLLHEMAHHRPDRPHIQVMPVGIGRIPRFKINDEHIIPSEFYLKVTLTAEELARTDGMQIALERCLAAEQDLFDQFARVSTTAPWIFGTRGSWQCVQREGQDGGWLLHRLVSLADAGGVVVSELTKPDGGGVRYHTVTLTRINP